MGNTTFLRGHELVGKSPNVLTLSDLITESKINFSQTTPVEFQSQTIKPVFNTSSWIDYTPAKSFFRQLKGYNKLGGHAVYQFTFIIPDVLFKSEESLAFAFYYIDFQRVRYFLNGIELSDADGTLRLNRTGVYSIPRSHIGADHKATITFLFDYSGESRGLSGEVNYLGPRKRLEQLYTSSERMVNTYYLLFACIKFGILSVFILLYLFSPKQKFLEYFIIYALMVSLDAFFIIDLSPSFLRKPIIQFFAVFNMQCISSYYMWFLVESILQIQIAFQRWIFAGFSLLMNLFIYMCITNRFQIITNTLVTFNSFIFLYVLTLCLFFLIKTRLKNKKTLMAELPISHIIFIFSAYMTAFIFNTLIVNTAASYRSAVDILFFLGISYIVAKEFASNQIKIQEQSQLLHSQSNDVSLGKSIARVAHDLRKPFQNFKLAVNILNQNHATDKSFNDILLQTNSSIGFAEGLIENILNDKRQAIPKLEKIYVKDYIVSLSELLLHPLKSKGIEFEIHNEVLDSFYIDTVKITAVFQNILNNAEEAMQDQISKKIKINFTMIKDSIGQAKCKIQIRNNGPRIPEHIIDQLFSSRISYGKTNGTGIGLYAVKEILSIHQGQIGVYNLPFNSGVEFELLIPLISDPKKIIPNRLIESNPSKKFDTTTDSIIPIMPNIGNIKNIAVVDDDQLIHMTWKLINKSDQIKQFYSPEEFLDSLAKHKFVLEDFDLIITDLYFDEKSKLDGFSFAKQLKLLNFSRIVLSSGSAPTTIEASERDQFIDVLDKEVLTIDELNKRYSCQI
jgi:signal transduction histidine kinase